MRRNVSAIIVLCSFLATASGCSTEEPLKPVTLTVNYPNAQQFYKLYGYAFEDAHPNISVQVVQDPSADPDTAPSTDVVFMNSLPDLEQRAERGDLADLDPLIRKDKFKVDTLSPIVLAMLKSTSGGNLYGLAANFQSEALYYNKKLFEQYKVPLPQNQMSWEEVLRLAMRFPHQTEDGTPLYGMHMNFYKNVSLNYVLNMGATEGLSYIDPKTFKVSINTDSWEKIWELAVKAFQSGSIYDKEESTDADAMLNPPFYLEQAAMTKASFLTAYNFEPFAKYPNGRTIDWGMVTIPVDPRNPSISRSYSIYEIYGVSSTSEKKEAAWELLTFIVNDSDNNTYLAKAAVNRGLPSNLKYLQTIPGHDLSPLYRLEPATESFDPYLIVPATILDAFAEAAQGILDETISGKMTVQQALAEAERQGQQAVDEAKSKLVIE